MKKYILTSASFTGSVVFGYVSGWLTFYHNESEMSEEQLRWCAKHLPVEETHLEDLGKLIKGRIRPADIDLSFDSFWESYGHKRNRHRCEPLWKKMNDTKRTQAIMSIEPYENYLRKKNIAKKLPENYLKHQEYLNDWNKL